MSGPGPESAALIRLEAAAPAKPEWGAACNGCGACCALETCPLGRILFRRIAGPCPALRWEAGQGRYFCRLAQPEGRWWRDVPARLAARWIAAGSGCDMDGEVDPC